MRKGTELGPVMRQLAEACGIQRSYVDTEGRTRHATIEQVGRALKAFGIDASTPGEARQRLAERRGRHMSRLVPPVAVCWNGSKTKIPIWLPEGKRVQMLLRTEEGDETRIQAGTLRRTREATLDGVTFQLHEMELANIPHGYHELLVESGGQSSKCTLISAPEGVYTEPEPTRQWGAFAPMYAVHSNNSWGGGNFSDWERFASWVAAQGGRLVGTLPILATFLGSPIHEPSPYSPASRLFWNEFFLDISALPEFAANKKAQAFIRSQIGRRQLARARRKRHIDYEAEMRLRRTILETLAKSFFSESKDRKELDQFLRARPEARDYARFRAACDTLKTSWHSWPDRARAGILEKTDYSREIEEYHLFVQWSAQRQIDKVLATCREHGVKFYLDLPVGVHPDSFDAWKYQSQFARGFNVGAPPDSFFTKGQDWGFAPLHPDAIREEGHSYVIDYLRFQMRHTGMLRIDHVMGLHRLYWVPQGAGPAEGVYVRYPAEELYAILSLESHRNRTLIVGENLGTVPPEVNKSMDRHGVRRMYVFQFEQPGRNSLPEPPGSVIASLNTHDMPGFAAHWAGQDISDRMRMGLLSKGEARCARVARNEWKKLVISNLRRKKLIAPNANSPAEILRGLLSFLGRSRAETVLVTLEDLWMERRPQNVPGTAARSNWSRKMRLSLEELTARRDVARFLGKLTRDRKFKAASGGVRTTN